MEFASLGIEIDSRPVVEGTKALDAFGEASARVEQKVRVSNGQMVDTAKLMRQQAEDAKAAAAAGASLANSTAALTLGQQQFIERMKEQAATVGMSRSQLLAYQAAQLGVTEQTREAIAVIKAHEDAMKANAAQTNVLTDALKLLAAGYAALKVGEYIKDAALLAARYETLGVVSEVVGRNAGYTKTQMDAATDAIARQGITLLESRQSAVKLVQAHVDLANATALARIAQDAAVIGNINSSEAFDRLTNGIARGNVLILRNIGINVNLQSAYAEMADQLGKTAKELTENERVQARLNAVIERGTDIAGTYEAAMGTAGKQILSMQRYTEDLKVKIGEAFNEVLTVGVMAFTDHLKDANGEVTELSKNGQLAEWGRDLTSVFVGVANAIDNILTGAKMAGTWAAHQSAGADINARFDKMSFGAPRAGSLAEQAAQQADIERQRQAAFAKEQSDYEASQTNLAGTFDRFQRAAEERMKARQDKLKSDADARLKVDQDYATRSQALLIANADKSLKIQQEAQAALAKEVYGGTPHYRDTEGREAADKVDQADAIRLQNKIQRIENAAAVEIATIQHVQTIEDMRHQAGEMGDESYYEQQRANADLIAAYQVDSLQKQLVALRAHHNSTEAEAEKNTKAILDTEDKLAAARKKWDNDDLVRDEQERLRKRALVIASDEASNKYLASLEKEAKKLEDSNAGHETTKGAVEREEVARLDLAIAMQQQVIEIQSIGGATLIEIEQGEKLLKFLRDQRDLRERIAKGLDTADVDAANKKAAEEASRAWKRTSDNIENDLANAILDGGGRGWKKLIRDMEVAFARVVLNPILQPISGAIASFANPGAAQAQAGGVAGGAGLISTASNAYTAYTGLTAAGGVGTGFVGSLAGGLMGAGEGAGLTSATGLAIGEGIAGIVGPGVASALSTGISAMATAIPYVAIAAAAAFVLKKGFGHGEREYTGSTLTGSFGADGFSGQTNNSWIEKGGWFSSNKKGVEHPDVTADVAKVYSDAYDQIKDASAGFAKSIGLDASSVETRSQQMNIALTKDDAENKKLIEDFFVAVGDTIAKELLPSVADFAKAGEGASATLQRIANDYVSLDKALSAMGGTFGEIGVDSIAARERLIDLSGGIQSLASKSQAYVQAFYTDAQKIDPVIDAVNAAMVSLNLASVKTKDQFKEQVDKLISSGDLATEAGAKLYANLMDLAPAFAQVADAAKNAAEEAAAAAKSVHDNLVSNVDTAISALKRSVDAEKKAKQAAHDVVMAGYEKSITAAQASISKLSSLSQSLKSTLDSMKLPNQEAASRAAAQAQIATSLAIARAGGPLPVSDDIQKALSTVAQDSSDLFTSYQDYQRDFSLTKNDISDLADLTGTSLTTEEKNLAALEKMRDYEQYAYDRQISALDNILDQAQAEIDAIKGVDTSVKALADAILGVNDASKAAGGAGAVSAPAATLADVQKYGDTFGSNAYFFDENNGYQAKKETSQTLAGILGMSESDSWMHWTGHTEAYWKEAQRQFDAGMHPTTESIKGFAAGGSFMGGLRIVGENGPELEATGPSRIFSNGELMSSLRGGGNAELLAEMRALRAEVIELRKANTSENVAIAKHTLSTSEFLDGAVNGETPILTSAA